MPLLIRVSALLPGGYDIFPGPLADVRGQGIPAAVHEVDNLGQGRHAQLLRDLLLARLQDGRPDPLDHVLQELVFKRRKAPPVHRRIHRLDPVDIIGVLIPGSAQAHGDMMCPKPGEEPAEPDIRPAHVKA